MKRALHTFCIVLMTVTFTYAQTDDSTNKKKTQFGVNVGYVNAIAKVKATLDDVSFSDSEGANGVSFGVSANSQISEKLYIQPSVNFAIIEDSNWLFVPVMLKYYVANKFNLAAGPQGTFSLEDTGDLLNTFGLDLSFGAGYDISDNFYLEARYALELTNRTPDASAFVEPGVDPTLINDLDLKTSINSFHIGVGYRFN